MRLPLPAPPGSNHCPQWTGTSFALGDREVRVVCYDIGSSGWTDALTQIHEDVDGEHHYMNVASREHAVRTLERWVKAPAPVLMDIGCSSGYTIKLLRERLPQATVVGADYVRGPLEVLGAGIPDLPLIQFDLARCPLPDACVDGVALLNVFEHIEDDLAAMRHVHRILKPGGIAAVEVPAGPELYDIYDRQLMHCRRYAMRDLLRGLRTAGFEILERSHLGFFLYPAFWAVKKRNRRLLGASQEVQRAAVEANMRQSGKSPLFHGLMRLEAAVRPWVYLPFGIRCLVTCRKP